MCWGYSAETQFSAPRDSPLAQIPATIPTRPPPADQGRSGRPPARGAAPRAKRVARESPRASSSSGPRAARASGISPPKSLLSAAVEKRPIGCKPDREPNRWSTWSSGSNPAAHTRPSPVMASAGWESIPPAARSVSVHDSLLNRRAGRRQSSRPSACAASWKLSSFGRIERLRFMRNGAETVRAPTRRRRARRGSRARRKPPAR